MAGIGAQRKHVTLPTDFRSPSGNGHSCYGHLTARFAPIRSLTKVSSEVSGGVESSRSRRASNFDLTAELDDPVGWNAEEFGRIEGEISQEDEQPVAPAKHGGTSGPR